MRFLMKLVLAVGIIALIVYGARWASTPTKRAETAEPVEITAPAQAQQPVQPRVEPQSEPQPQPEFESVEETTTNEFVEMFRGEPSLTKSEILYFFAIRTMDAFNEEEEITWDNFAHNLAMDFKEQNKESSIFLESVYKKIMERDPQFPALVARQLKIIPGAEKTFQEFGAFFVKKYASMDWDAKLVAYQGEKITWKITRKTYRDQINSESLYSEPTAPKRDAQGRLFTCDGGKMLDINTNVCPDYTFANEDYERNWRKIDKMVYRAGPQFYQNAKWFYERTLAELEKIKND